MTIHFIALTFLYNKIQQLLHAIKWLVMVDEDRSAVFVFSCILFFKMSKPFYGVSSQPRSNVP